MNVRQPEKSALRRWGTLAALALVLGGVSACESLLEVDLPGAVTEEALQNPSNAALGVNSIMAGVECAYSSFALDAAGYEDNFQRVSGVAGLYSEYRDTPSGGSCDGDAYSSEWMAPMLTARKQGYSTYQRLSDWTDEEVENRSQLLAQAALYTAVTLDVFGEHFCEMTVDEGPLMTPEETLDLAEAWVDSAFVHIDDTGDFPVTASAGDIAPSIEQMAHGLRARIRWAKGDLAGAAAEAAEVEDDFVAYVLREAGEDRRNMVSSMQGGGGGVQAAGFLQGPVKEKTEDNDYGVSVLGTHPTTGEDWPDPVPFTGYLNLAIDETTGRAIDDEGYPLTEEAGGTVPDTRVEHTIGNTAGGERPIIQKYTSLSDDIPLINWKEMRLIQAEEAGGTEAIGFVNDIRAADGLPLISGAYEDALLADEEEMENMLIEERRRALWLEGRFWSTKIQNANKLWFPRNVGDWMNEDASYVLNGGVRVLMDEDEYQINPNLSLADRGTGCAAEQAPVFN